MAFKPITVTETIDGKKYTAQFCGVSGVCKISNYENDVEKLVDFLFENVIVEPKISDIDEYFGVKVKHMNKVIEFAKQVLSADEKYFPENTDNEPAETGSKK